MIATKDISTPTDWAASDVKEYTIQSWHCAELYEPSAELYCCWRTMSQNSSRYITTSMALWSTLLPNCSFGIRLIWAISVIRWPKYNYFAKLNSASISKIVRILSISVAPTTFFNMTESSMLHRSNREPILNNSSTGLARMDVINVKSAAAFQWHICSPKYLFSPPVFYVVFRCDMKF